MLLICILIFIGAIFLIVKSLKVIFGPLDTKIKPYFVGGNKNHNITRHQLAARAVHRFCSMEKICRCSCGGHQRSVPACVHGETDLTQMRV